MDWTVLGIEPTKDKNAIKRAYRARIVNTNPEDKPEEFKALRAAYEQAMELAGQEEVPQAEQTPVERWAERVRALYEDYPRRIDPACWQELLADDLCVALDTRGEVETALLRFFMERYDIPQAVWQCLDEAFSFQERQQELYENYPRDFVDYVVLNGIRYRENLPVAMFTPGKNGADCDAYLHLYNKAARMPYEEAAPLLAEMAALSEQHPYGQALACRAAIAGGEEARLEELKGLSEAYPDNHFLAMELAEQLAENGLWAESEAICRRVVEQNDRHNRARWILAQALAKQEKYSEAVELVAVLMHAAGGDQKQLYQLNEVRTGWNEALIQQYVQKLEENPDDHRMRLDLAWCYLQNNRDEEALAQAEQIDSAALPAFDYHNLMSQVYHSADRLGEALEHTEKLIEAVRALQPDGTEKTQRRIDRLAEMIGRRAHCLLRMEKKEEAMAAYEEALTIAPEDPELLTQLVHIHYSLKDYPRAAEFAARLTRVRPDAYHGYLLLAQALFEQHQDRDAFEAVNHALELDRSDLGEYILKLRILIRNGAFEQAHEVIDFLHENGIDDVLAIQWCEALLTEYETKDNELALAQQEAIAKRLEAGESLPWGAEVYFRIAVLTARDLDARHEVDREGLFAILEKGLAIDKDDFLCLDYKAWLLKREKRIDEALEIYHRLEKMPRGNLDVERQLAELYYNDLGCNADKSLHYYELLLKEEDTPDDHFYAGMCQLYLGNLEQAEAHFLREQEQEPDVMDGYYRLGYVYEAMGRLDEALEQANKTLEIVRKEEKKKVHYYLRNMQILRRMGRWEDAVAVVRQAMDECEYKGGNQMIFDIYTQFGRLEEARAHLKTWRKDKNDRSASTASLVKWHVLMGNLMKAKLNCANYRGMMNQDDAWSVDSDFFKLDGNHKAAAKAWKKRLEKKQKERDEQTYELMSLAEIYWRMGDVEQSRSYARQALEQLDEILSKNLRDEAIYRSRRAMVLGLLGEEAAARAELERIRSLPLCEHCDYCRCKDADIYEMYLEAMFGNYECSHELAQKGKENWPDEIDFISHERDLKRKGH